MHRSVLPGLLLSALLLGPTGPLAASTGWIGDRVWDDLDGNGLQDADEPGRAGVFVRLLDCDGTELAATSSGIDGGYEFEGLAPGSYAIAVTPPAGMVLSPAFQGGSRILDSNPDPTTGRTGCMPLADGQARPGVDAGLRTAGALAHGSIGDRVWRDDDADGLQDPSEPGMAGVTLRLLGCDGTVLAQTTSDGTGRYAFHGLAPDDYAIEVAPPAGFLPSPAFRGDSRTLDSNPRPTTGRTGCMSLAESQARPGIDVGLVAEALAAPGRIGDRVWQDLDGDGLQGAHEPGMSGVTLRLLDCGGQVLATTSSAADGAYTFGGLATGSYRIEVLVPGGFTLSPAFRGESRIEDSNPDPATGRTGCMSMVEGQTRVGIDAGLVAEAAPARPNVVLVVIDDLNDFVGTLGGHPQASTPNLDRLADEGIAFTNAHVAGPSCNAARSSFITGISPARSGITANPGGVGTLRDNLPDAVSLVKAFRDGGYHTVRYGKIFHGGQENADWDVYGGSADTAPPPEAIPLSGLDFEGVLTAPAQWDWGPLPIGDEEMADYRNVDKALGFLDSWRGEKPFFLALGLTSTHLPWYCPSSAFDQIANGSTSDVVLPEVYPGDLDDVGPMASTWAAPEDYELIALAGQERHAVHAYLACGAFLDRQLGRLLDGLDGSALGANTVVAVLSDHGFHLGEKSTWSKFKLWEEDTRVPFVLHLPDGLVNEPVQRIEEPVNVSAIFPTLLELADIPLPAYLPGDPLYRIDYRSLLPLVESGGAAQAQSPAVSFNYGGNVSIRTRDYRFTLYRNGFVELYDHRVDPDERDNLYAAPEHQQRIGDWILEAQRYLTGDHEPL